MLSCFLLSHQQNLWNINLSKGNDLKITMKSNWFRFVVWKEAKCYLWYCKAIVPDFHVKRNIADVCILFSPGTSSQDFISSFKEGEIPLALFYVTTELISPTSFHF